jgi:hypothetical protein
VIGLLVLLAIVVLPQLLGGSGSAPASGVVDDGGGEAVCDDEIEAIVCRAIGDLAAQYIVAHENGHHVQTITGINEAMEIATQQGRGAATRTVSGSNSKRTTSPEPGRVQPLLATSSTAPTRSTRRFVLQMRSAMTASNPGRG